MATPIPARTRKLPSITQLAALAQLIVIICLTAVFFRLRVLESVTSKQDFESIVALANLADSDIHTTLGKNAKTARDTAKDLERVLQERVIGWLGREHAAIDAARREVRTQVVTWLKANGMSNGDVVQLSGKGGNGKVPFVFFRLEVTDFNTPFDKLADIGRDPPIGMLLEETEYMATPFTVVIATGLREEGLSNLQFKMDQGSTGSPSERTYRVGWIRMEDTETLQCQFVLKGRAQQRVTEELFPIPVATATIENVRLLDLVKEDGYALRLEDTVLKRTDRLERVYGDIRVRQARELTGSLMLESYREVSMLGFRFAPTDFWIIVCAFLAVILFSSGVHLLGGATDDEAKATSFGLHVLLTKPFCRIILWCFAPGVAMLLTFPETDPSTRTRCMFWASLLVLTAGGVWLTWLSFRRHIVGEGSAAAPDR